MSMKKATAQQLRHLRRRRVPAWWLDAKLGIFVQWTIASVPAFAPVEGGINEVLATNQVNTIAHSPYVEWYENSLRFPESPVAKFHEATFPGRTYHSFAADFEAGGAEWDPQDWAKKFAATGARYVVFDVKHHDGYCLWPTAVVNPHRPGWHSQRDLVGEMAAAVRGAGMHFGIYYSGGLDWTFDATPLGTVAGVLGGIPRGDYVAYADAHVRELIDRYQPSILWNDIAWPSTAADLWQLFDYYYQRVPDGVVNDRWTPYNWLFAVAHTSLGCRVLNYFAAQQMKKDGGLVPPTPPHYDFRTPEYTSFADAQKNPWECIRGIDRSFGYNAFSRREDFLSRPALLTLLADVVAKGGNLLLNVGPRGTDAIIPEEQQLRLDWLGEWTKRNGSALFATRPWVVAQSVTSDEVQVRYTSHGESVFALLVAPGERIVLRDVAPTPRTTLLSMDGRILEWRETHGGIEVESPALDADLDVIECRYVVARPLAERTAGD